MAAFHERAPRWAILPVFDAFTATHDVIKWTFTAHGAKNIHKSVSFVMDVDAQQIQEATGWIKIQASSFWQGNLAFANDQQFPTSYSLISLRFELFFFFQRWYFFSFKFLFVIHKWTLDWLFWLYLQLLLEQPWCYPKILKIESSFTMPWNPDAIV